VIGNSNDFLADSLDEQTDGQNALLDLWVIKSGTHSVSLLICKHFSRKVVLQPEKKVGLLYKPASFLGLQPEKKSEFAEPLF
jgi:hypothetical protein